MVVALVPVAVATGRAIDRGWVAVGDNAFFAIRARDVLTDHHPLLGTWTSASAAAGKDLNNPGPLFFDVLALPASLAERGAGLAVGVALVNALAVLGIAVMAYRRGGPLLATAAMAVTAGLSWAMGSEVLFEPWQPHSMLLPFLCFLMLVWSVACGDLVALPWAAGVGSLLLQTHLSYGVLVPALGASAVVGLGLELPQRRRRDPRAWPGLRRRAWGAGMLAGVVLLVCWAQPFAEQLTSEGEGNLSRLGFSLGDAGSEAIGFDLGARLVANVVALPPWWLRPSFEEAFPSDIFDAGVPSLGLAIASLVLLAVVLAGCGWEARRRRDRETSRAVVIAAIAVSAGLITAGRASAGFGTLPPHQFRWLWPLGAFVFFAVLATLARSLGRGGVPSASLVGAFALATVVFAGLNLPTTNQGVGPNAYTWSIPVARELGSQMAALEGEGALLVDIRRAGFDDPYGVAVMAELQRRGVPFVVDDPVLVRQLGPSRRFTGANAQATLLLRVGDKARATPPGARPVAIVDGLTAEERVELAELESRIGEYIRGGRLRLTERGRQALAAGFLPKLARQSSQPEVDPAPLFKSGELVRIVRADLLVLGDEWARRFERYATLHERQDNETVALFLRPLGAPADLTDPNPQP